MAQRVDDDDEKSLFGVFPTVGRSRTLDIAASFSAGGSARARAGTDYASRVFAEGACARTQRVRTSWATYRPAPPGRRGCGAQGGRDLIGECARRATRLKANMRMLNHPRGCDVEHQDQGRAVVVGNGNAGSSRSTWAMRHHYRKPGPALLAPIPRHGCGSRVKRRMRPSVAGSAKPTRLVPDPTVASIERPPNKVVSRHSPDWSLVGPPRA